MRVKEGGREGVGEGVREGGGDNVDGCGLGS